MLSTQLCRVARRFLSPVALALVLSVAVGLTVATPAFASGEFTISATLSGDDTILIHAAGTAGQNDVAVSLYANPSATPCGATPNAEVLMNAPALDSKLVYGSPGPFTLDSSYSPNRAGTFIICGYLGQYTSSSATTQSASVGTYPCATDVPDTAFTISNVKIGTGRYADPHTGKSEAGDYHGGITFTITADFPGFAYGGDTPQIPLDLGLGDNLVGGGGTYSGQTATITLHPASLGKSGQVDDLTVLAFPLNDVGACTMPDGTVATLGSGPNDYHAPVQNLKISFGAPCQGGTLTIDGQSAPVTNDSAKYTSPTPYGTEDCNGHITPAKSGKCTQFTKLAKGYVCSHGKVVKAKPKKRRR